MLKKSNKQTVPMSKIRSWNGVQHVKPHRRTCHVLLLGDRHEISQMTEFHLRQYT